MLNIPCACLHVRRAGRRVSSLYDAFLRPSGLRVTQYGMLRCVEQLPDPYISDIGRVLGMDQTTVTRNIEKLERQGLVETLPHPDDPRKKRVELTAEGQSRMRAGHALWTQAQEQVLAKMGAGDYAELLRLLDKLSLTADA